MHRDGLEFVGALIQRIDELDIAVTAQAEHLRNFLLDQIVDDNLGTIERITCAIALLSCSLNDIAAQANGAAFDTFSPARETYFP